MSLRWTDRAPPRALVPAGALVRRRLSSPVPRRSSRSPTCCWRRRSAGTTARSSSARSCSTRRAYARGGAVGLEREIRASQVGAAPGPFFVRTIGARQDVLFLSIPEAWRRFDLSQLAAPPHTDEQGWATIETGDGGDVLEVASLRFADGTIFQVGTSTERREEMLRRVPARVAARLRLDHRHRSRGGSRAHRVSAATGQDAGRDRPPHHADRAHRCTRPGAGHRAMRSAS